ncbi:MAG: chorismate-binding protein [Acidimicrobiia bacterium]|nr:chorismate-binding protein [Acidimicrobiia bacterium]
MATLVATGTAIITVGSEEDGLLDRPDLVWYWSDENETVMGFGAAVIIPVPTGPKRLARLDNLVTGALASLTVEDHRPPGGPKLLPRAFGALPFDRHTSGAMVIPQLTVGRAAPQAGQTGLAQGWRCEVSLADAEPISNDVLHERLWWPAGEGDEVTQPEWEAMVKASQQQMRDGNLEKVVLSRRTNVFIDAPLQRGHVIRSLNAANPGAYVYCAGNFVGATPELLVERKGLTARCRPMAGTAWPVSSERNGNRQARDRRAGHGDATLITGDKPHDGAGAMTAKDRHEHTIVVGPLIERLAEVTLRVRSTAPVEVDAGPLKHLATTVEADLPADFTPTALGLVAALHPTGAVAGHPRDAALECIAALEPQRRGPYAGPVGWIDSSGDGRFGVAVRSAVLGTDRATCFAGAGIVEESDPSREWVETEQKLQVMKTALGRCATC